ncbi:trimeric intracellular cation channel family protein [Magnetococcus sp. PR-3]|uniref:trimeric intracellular cation channel family protein n=1 Tax=Magnetococcus sp. PR-3 TaxID=3120355 RepID=UPI002FCE387C
MTDLGLDQVMYWIGQGAVASMAMAGVLEAGKKHFDLFGVLIVAMAASLGGGSLRDLLLDRGVFWVVDQTYLIAALLAAFCTFYLARLFPLNERFFLVPDAIGLALFSITGTEAALALQAPWLVASVMGLFTGVMGGVLRDLFLMEQPLVFREGTLYATAAWAGALLFILLLALGVAELWAALSGGLCTFLLRMAAIRWGIALPTYRSRS